MRKRNVYLVYDGLGIKEKQLNGSIVLQVGYTLYIEPAITEGTSAFQCIWVKNYHIYRDTDYDILTGKCDYIV